MLSLGSELNWELFEDPYPHHLFSEKLRGELECMDGGGFSKSSMTSEISIILPGCMTATWSAI